jgi:hypothetical protein
MQALLPPAARPVGRAFLDRHTNRWMVTLEPHAMTMAKRIFPKINKTEIGTFYLADTPETALHLQWFAQLFPLEWDPPGYVDQRAQLFRAQATIIDRILGNGYTPPKFSLAIPPRDYQARAAALVLESGALLLGDDLGTGKAQPLDAKVLTPTGWRLMGDLCVGDAIVDPDGGTATILGVYDRGERAVYRVTTSDGQSTECCDEHLWLVQTPADRRRGTSRVLELRQFKDRLWRVDQGSEHQRARGYFLPVARPSTFNAWSRVTVSPYLLGVLIGDGTFRKSSVDVTTADRQIVREVRARLPRGVRIVRASRYTYRLSVGNGGGDGNGSRNPLVTRLRAMGLMGKLAWEKAIPEPYMRASVWTRKELLKGLMDTDGEADTRGRAYFHTTSPMLAEQVRELVTSLGGFASLRSRVPKFKYNGTMKDGRRAYRLDIQVPWCPFRLRRKIARWKMPLMCRGIDSVEYVGRKQTRCIRVDSRRSLYITDGYIVTHNSVCAFAMLSDPRALPAVYVTMTHLPGQVRDMLARFAPALRVHVVKIGTPYDITKKPRSRKGEKLPMPDVIVISWSKLGGWAETLAKILDGKGSVIYDEAHELRHPTTARYAAARHLAAHATYKLAMTATPVFGVGSQIYHVISAIKPDALGTWEEFVREWCEADGSDKPVVKDPDALGAYLRRTGLMLRRTRAEVGRELPPLQRVIQPVEYDERPLAEAMNFATNLASTVLRYGDGITKMKAAGELDWRLRMATGLAKARAAIEFIRLLLESGERVLVGLWHREMYDLFMKGLAEWKPAMYSGSESTVQKRDSQRRFCDPTAPDQTPVLLMSNRSGAGLDGIQYSGCSVVVIVELDWAWSAMLQFEGRVHRDGQPNPVMAYYLMTNSGSDPVIAEVLGLKRAQLEALNDPYAPRVEKAPDQHAIRDRMRRLALDHMMRHDPMGLARIRLEAETRLREAIEGDASEADIATLADAVDALPPTTALLQTDAAA